MTQSKEFIEAVKNENLNLVRVMIKDSLVMDPTFKEFNERISYAKKSISDLFEEHDNEVLQTEKSEWTKNYMNTQLNNLMYNFSKERIEHLKKVCQFVYADRINNIAKNSSGQENIKVTGTKSVSTSVVIGGVGLAIAGIALEKAVLVAGGAVLAVAGGIMLINNNK
ncbi:hypothetical protein [Clostridium botulinum]|uniref:hypothetical protein n=1 Tax=Clostridium botulinum TaxID=1491 RepID=UPI001967A44F|nr:hypothetical protein [Clostridium botulinum]MBN1065539.1 hypothetical protein [Clostridium botulinum]